MPAADDEPTVDPGDVAADLRTLVAQLHETLKDLRAELAASREDANAARELAAEQALRIEELEARLRRDSGSSSKPPSSDGPWSKRRRRRRPPSERRQGAQPGHPGKTRGLVEEGDVDEVVDHEPDACSGCGHDVLLASGAAPRRRQVVEIPSSAATVTEHRLHRRECARCGKTVVAKAPAAVARSAFGPRLHAVAATLVADCRASRAETARFLGEAFGVRLSVGSVSNMERRMSDALAAAHEEALAAFRASDVVHVDETPWKKGGELHWVWSGVGEDATVHRIDRRRNREALGRLMGEDFEGLLVTDRLATYDCYPCSQRQLCWAHLERDFRAFVQGPAAGRAFGEKGLGVAQALMRCAREHKEHGDRERLAAEVAPHLGDLIDLLVEGACSAVPKVSGFAAHLLARNEALWTFVDHDGVPATNNAAERAIRKAVMWRRGSFGSQSDRGLRFVERMLTVIATKRRRTGGVLDYLVEVARAALGGSAAPSLLA